MKILPIIPFIILLGIYLLLMVTTGIILFRRRAKTSEKVWDAIRLGAIYTLALCIGLRPVTVEGTYEFNAKNLDVLFVMDTTISMWAEDYNGKNKRMKGVVDDMDLIIDELVGSNFALITFADEAMVVSPFTQEFQYIQSVAHTQNMPLSNVARGSDMSIPYKDMESFLIASSKKENRKTIVFFISDGEITNGKELVSYAPLAEYIDGGAVLGYGSEDGGYMKESDWGYVSDHWGDEAISRIDESNLQQIATDLGVEYLNLNKGNSSLAGLIETIKRNSKTIVDKGTGVEMLQDTYYYYAVPLAILLLLELAIVIRKGRL